MKVRMTDECRDIHDLCKRKQFEMYQKTKNKMYLKDDYHFQLVLEESLRRYTETEEKNGTGN